MAQSGMAQMQGSPWKMWSGTHSEISQEEKKKKLHVTDHLMA